MNRRALPTGGNSFVGRALCPALAAAGFTLRRAVRSGSLPEAIAVGDIGGGRQRNLAACSTEWQAVSIMIWGGMYVWDKAWLERRWWSRVEA